MVCARLGCVAWIVSTLAVGVVQPMLAVKPRPQAAVVGSRVVLACGTDMVGKLVNWSQRPIGTGSRLSTNRIFVQGQIPSAKQSNQAIVCYHAAKAKVCLRMRKTGCQRNLPPNLGFDARQI